MSPVVFVVEHPASSVPSLQSAMPSHLYSFEMHFVSSHENSSSPQPWMSNYVLMEVKWIEEFRFLTNLRQEFENNYMEKS